MKKVTEYLFGTVLPCFVKKWQKKYATLVIAYLKRSFEEKSFHFFYCSSIIIQEHSYNKFFVLFVFHLYNRDYKNVIKPYVYKIISHKIKYY